MASIEIMQKTYCAIVQYVALLRHMQKLTIMLVNQLLYTYNKFIISHIHHIQYNAN